MAKKNTKGLFSDTGPIDQPENTYPFGKNGVQDYKKAASFNEPGFVLSSAVIPYTHMGTIETDQNPIIFSTDDTNSAIGFFNPDTDTYTPIFDDTALDFKLGFKMANYITGQYQKDHKGEYVAVFTDKVLPLRYINCTTPDINKPEDALFFLRARAPQVTATVEAGGQVPTGAHIFYIKYAKNDGSETPYITNTAPVIISAPDGSGVSSSAVRLTLTGTDPTYDQVLVSVLSKINGVSTAVQLQPVSLSANMSILYTGNNTTTAISIEELLIAPAVYNTVYALTQLNDALYIGNLTQSPSPKFQKYAGLIKVRFISKEVDMNNIPQSVLSGLEKGFPHGEACALYIRLKMTDGSKSKAFIIAGRPAESGETDVITDSGVTAKRFQIHDTILFPNSVERTGTPGLWVNADETYPDDPEFDSSAIGGENLRNQPVRHHKFPTHHWIANNFNAGDSTYGKSKLDMLGIRLSGVTIPIELQGIVDTYEILYAERTTANATVLGQSEVIYAAQALSAQQTGNQSNFQSSGGNWKSVGSNSTYRDINKASDGPLTIVTNRIRMFPFELLFNKIELPQSDCYIQFEWKIRQDNILSDSVVSYGVDTTIKASDRKATDIKPVVYVLDAKANNNAKVTITSDSDFLRKLTLVQYTPHHTNAGEFNNSELETSVTGRLSTNGPAISISQQNVAVGDKMMQNLQFQGYVHFEECFLGTLRVLKNNIYDSFLSQSLVSTGTAFDPSLSTSGDIFAGDTFPCDYTVNNYGWVSAFDGVTGVGNQNLAGTKVMRRFICESVANINQRFETAGNIYSRWYPHNTIGYQSAYIMDFDRAIDPNQFGYSRDLNTLNNFETITIFNPFVDDINVFPYRIARGGQFKREGVPASWRTFLPLDYYDMPKNRGVIINLAGLDDNLLIHHESALYVTQDKTTLQGNVLKVTLGTADIFQYAPLEGVGTKLGYAGTHHDLAAVIVPAGYVFVDDTLGQVFLFKSNLKLINMGINIFLRNFTKISQHNPYMGNGITIGYDPDFNRILLTSKHSQLSTDDQADVVPDYEPTQAFFDTLDEGVSIVYHNGTYMRFQGLNDTEFDCPDSPDDPTITGATYTVAENVANGTLVGTPVTTDPADAGLTYLIISGNTGGAFAIDIAGKLRVAAGSLDHDTKSSYTLVIRVVDINGNNDSASFTVNVTAVPKPPTTADTSASVPEASANGTAVVTVAGVDPRSLTLTFSIISGNTGGVFGINSATGAITVADNTNLSYADNPYFNLVVGVRNTATLDAFSHVAITVTTVGVPAFADGSGSIPANSAIGSLALTGVAAVDAAADAANRQLIYALVSESVPGKFTVGLDPTDPTTFLKFKVTAALTSGVTYTIVLSATDIGGPGQSPSSDNATFSITADAAFHNVDTSQDFTKNNCADGFVGSLETYDVPADTYSSFVSQAAADQLAQDDIDANGQAHANAVGSCTFAGFSFTRSKDFQKNNCSGGLFGSIINNMKTYYSAISTGDAEATAMADSTFDTTGQNHANFTGSCMAIGAGLIGRVVVDIDTDTTADLTGFVSTAALAPTDQGVWTGQNFFPADETPAGLNYVLASDAVTGVGSVAWRFEFNIQRLMLDYPAVTSFEFKISGRNTGGGTISGHYDAKFMAGSMGMNGTTGSYLPVTLSSSSIAVTAYSGKAITSGADGSHGIGVGADILVFTYNVTTNTLTLA